MHSLQHLENSLTPVGEPAESFVAMLRQAAEGAPMEPAAVALGVERLLAHMKDLGMASELPVEHLHTEGMYARQLTLPAGTFAIGEIQKFGHINVISQGEISMLNEDGTLTLVRAPFTCVGVPGVRKCGYAHTDVVWTTVHNLLPSGIEAPERASLQELESYLVARSPEELELFMEARKQIGAEA